MGRELRRLIKIKEQKQQYEAEEPTETVDVLKKSLTIIPSLEQEEAELELPIVEDNK